MQKKKKAVEYSIATSLPFPIEYNMLEIYGAVTPFICDHYFQCYKSLTESLGVVGSKVNYSVAIAITNCASH